MPGFTTLRPFQTVRDLEADAELIRARRFGLIEMIDGRLERVLLRPWPKTGSILEARLLGRLGHGRRRGNRCRLYYNQPWSAANYLALRYVVSTRDCTLATFHGALAVLDKIARVKRSDAIVCDVSNRRISDRLLARWGWEPHTSDRRHRHFIKRFYGVYPQAAALPLEAAGAV